jgi:hypothetical protein
MPGVLNLGDILELINDRFDDGALPQQQVFRQRHQAVLHIRTQLGNHANTEGFQQELKEWLGDVAFVAKQFAEQVFDQFRDRLSLTTKCNLKPKNQPVELLPRWARPANTLCCWIRKLWHTAKGVESMNEIPVHRPKQRYRR